MKKGISNSITNPYALHYVKYLLKFVGICAIINKKPKEKLKWRKKKSTASESISNIL